MLHGISNTFLVCLVVVSLACSCQAPNSYQRSYTFVPNTEKLGDIEARGTISFNHSEGMLAVAPSQYLNTFAQVYAGNIGHVFDYGLGGYYRFDIVKVQLLGGFGTAHLDQSTRPRTSSTHTRSDTKTFYVQDTRFTKRFIQPSFQIDLSKKVTIGAGMRYNEITYSKWNLKKVVDVSPGYTSEIIYPLFKREGIVQDAFGFLRVREEHFSIDIQYGRSNDDFSFQGTPKYTPGFLNISLGLNVNVKTDLVPADI